MYLKHLGVLKSYEEVNTPCKVMAKWLLAKHASTHGVRSKQWIPDIKGQQLLLNAVLLRRYY
jgi:hypothetical protein